MSEGVRVGSVFFDIVGKTSSFFGDVKKSSAFAKSAFGSSFKSIDQQAAKAFSSLGKASADSSKKMADGYTKALNDSQMKAQDAKIALDLVRNKMDALTAAAKKDQSENLQKMQAEAEKAGAELDRLDSKMDSFVETFRAKNKQAFAGLAADDSLFDLQLSWDDDFIALQAEIDKAASKAEELEQAISKSEDASNDSAVEGTAAYRKLAAEAEKLGSTFTQQQARASHYRRQLDALSKSARQTTDSFDARPAKRFGSAFKSTFNTVSQGMKRFSANSAAAFKQAAQGAKPLGGALVSAFKKGLGMGKRFLKTLRGLGVGMTGLLARTKKTGNAFDNLRRRLLRLASAAVVFNVLSRALRELTTYLGSALKANDQFAASLAAVKGNLLTAFQPIYEAVMPALNTFMASLQKATAYLAAFTNYLFGKSVKASQNAAKSLYGQVKALGDTEKAAKKAGGALLAFDELNNLSNDDAEESSGASAVAAPSFDADLTPMEDFFAQFATIPDAFYAVGKKIAEAIATTLGNIDWERIKAGAKTAGQSLAEFIGGFAETPEMFGQLGRTFSEGLNTVATFLVAFADRMSDKGYWHTLGNSLAYGMNVAIATWDPELSGQAVYKNLNGILDLIYTFFTGTRWGELGGKVATFLNTSIEGADWNLLGRTFASRWNALTDFLYEFVTTFDWVAFGTAIGTAVASWFDEIDWEKIRETIRAGIHGILDAMTAFLDAAGLKDGFANDLLRGFIDLLHRFTDWALDHPKTIANITAIMLGFVAAWGLAKAALLAWNTAVGVWNMISAIATGLTTAFGAAVAFLTSPIGLVVLAVAALIAIIVLLVKHWDKIKEAAKACWDAIVQAFQNAGKWFKEKVVDPVAEFFTGLWTGLKDGAKKAWEKVTDVFKAARDWFREKVTDPVKELFDNLAEAAKKPFNSILGALERMINGIVDGVNWIFRTLNRLSFTIPDWVPGIGGGSFGFNFQEIGQVAIPKLAKGGFVDQPTLAMIGEAGAEAVVPLENNTGWMVTLANILAEAIAGKLMSLQAQPSGLSAETLQLVLDGRVMGEALLDYILQAARRRGLNLAVR